MAGFTIRFDYDRAATHPPGDGYTLRPNTPLTGIVLHSTEGQPGSTFEHECEYLRDSKKSSTHYIVAKDGRIQRILDTIYRAWHAGVSSWRGRADCNDYMVGIEAHHREGEPWPAEQREAIRWLVLELLRDHPTIKTENIVAHRWIALPLGRKPDPTDWPDAELKEWIAGLDAPADRPFTGPCTISVKVAQKVLCDYGSQILGELGVQPLIDVCDYFHVNFAVALAFCEHENKFLTVEPCAGRKNWGCVRTPENPLLALPDDGSGYARYAWIRDALEDWCLRMTGPKYRRADGSQMWVREALLKYAPFGDGSNNPVSYANEVLKRVAQWESGLT